MIVVHNREPTCQVPPVFTTNVGGVVLQNDVGFYRSVLEASRKVEVREGHVTGLLDEHVLWLQIPISDPHGMEVLERADYLGQIKPDHGGGENAVVLAVAEDVEVAAGAVRDGPAHELVGFERPQEGRQKWVRVRI